MLDLDIIKALYFIYPVINGFIILFFALYVLFYKVSTPLIHVFFVGRLFVVWALLLMLFRGQVSDFLSIKVGNTLLYFGLFSEIYAVFSIDKKFKLKEFLKLNLIPLFFVVFYMLFVASATANTRIVLSSIILGSIYLIGGIVLVTNKSKTKIQYLTGFLLIIATLGYFFRSYKASVNENYSMFVKNDFELVFYLYLFFLGFYLAISLLLILHEKNQAKMKETNLKLQELNKSKNKFFSIIAHDLRGPLGNLQQIGEMLWQDEESINQSTRKKLTKSLYKNSKKTFNLLDNLLKWANSNSGNLEINLVKLNLKKIVSDNVALFKTMSDLKNIELTSNLNEDLFINGDYNMINTVIRNIISNAVKFTNTLGKIEVNSVLNTNSDFHTIEVIDNGVGMDKDIALKLIEIDSLTSTLGTDNEKGTGLGLKLCKEFISKNNGEISIESEKNKGTSVSISLPKYIEK